MKTFFAKIGNEKSVRKMQSEVSFCFLPRKFPIETRLCKGNFLLTARHEKDLREEIFISFYVFHAVAIFMFSQKIGKIFALKLSLKFMDSQKQSCHVLAYSASKRVKV